MSNVQLGYTQVIDPISFKSIPSGKIYIGEYGALPNPANASTLKKAYFVNSDGTRTAASQPIRTNAAGFAVDGSGNIKTIQVDGGYSLLVQDQYGATKFSQACSAANSGAVLEFDTIAGFTGALDGSVCYFKGRDTAGDGGGGPLRFLAGSTATADGVTIYNATGGRLVRDLQSEIGINIKWAGAKGNGVTDDTAAIQAAIKAGAWNGTKVWAPNGTYVVNGTVLIGTDGTNNFYSVNLEGESTHGTVFLRKAGSGTGPIITVSGFHNIPEKLTLLSEVSGGAYSASHGIYVRGNPQSGTNGLGTKECTFKQLKIQRVGVGIQVGNYDVDGVDPDIETNSFHAIEISECNGGVFINGQNVLHNPFYNCHIVNCRDYLVKQTRGSDLWFERSYFGGMYDYLTGNYNVPATAKIVANAGVVGFVGCRSEDWASSTGNTTPRFALSVNGSAMPVVYLAGNVFTTRDDATTEPCISIKGSGSAGSVTTKATLIDNYFGGYVSFDTVDIFSVGNTYAGTGAGVTNGRILSANQVSGTFRDVFLDSNQTMELPGAKFKRNSHVPVTLERAAVATGSEWLGAYFTDAAGKQWNRVGVRVTNGTAAAEYSATILGNRWNGAWLQRAIGFGTSAPTTGTWERGDRIFNADPTVGQPKSWVCTVAGSPGTWVSEGNL